MKFENYLNEIINNNHEDFENKFIFNNDKYFDYTKGKNILSNLKEENKKEIFVEFMNFINEEILKITLSLEKINYLELDPNKYYEFIYFQYINYVALYKILKKHDKLNSLLQIGVEYLDKYKFNNSFFIDVDHKKMILSYHLSLKTANSNNTLKNETNGTFVRNSTKYLFLHEYRSQVESLILKNGIMLDEINNVPLYDTFVESTYFDNERFECYNDRSLKKDRAILIRCRKYNGNPPYFLERKTHFDLDQSKKERQILPFNFNLFIDCSLDSLHLTDPLLIECKRVIDEKKLKPVVNIKYHRTSFQNDIAGVRFTLDRDMEFSYDKKNVKFDFCILEVKTQGSTPEWIDQMIKNNNMILIPNFSKYTTAVNSIYNVDNKLYWSLDILKEQFKQNISKNNQEKNTIYPIVTNPNLFISNERSFVQWVTIIVSISKINTQIDNIWWFYLLRSLFTVGAMATALFMYNDRLNAFINKNIDPNKYVCKFKPFILAFWIYVMFLLTVSINFSILLFL